MEWYMNRLFIIKFTPFIIFLFGRSVEERFDIAKSLLSISFRRVIEALNDIAGNIIEWPRGEKATLVKQTFQHISGLPNVLGAIDRSYIEIKVPKVCEQIL